MKSYGRWQIHRYDTLDSTSDEARRLVESGAAAPPFVVWADRQTRGRGRGANAWWSDAGSLTATLVVDPRHESIRIEQTPLISLAAAYAVANLLEGWSGRTTDDRWPNDVEFDGRKAAGLLCESVETPDGPRLLIGVGINVATRFDGAPSEVRALATSLAEIAPAVRSRSPRLLKAAVLLRLIREADRALHGLASGFGFIEWVRRRDALDGRRVRIVQGSRIVVGLGRGIADDGALRVETEGGIVAIYAGQVLREPV